MMIMSFAVEDVYDNDDVDDAATSEVEICSCSLWKLRCLFGITLMTMLSCWLVGWLVGCFVGHTYA